MTFELIMTITMLCNQNALTKDGQAQQRLCQKQYIVCVNSKRIEQLTKERQQPMGELLAQCVVEK